MRTFLRLVKWLFQFVPYSSLCPKMPFQWWNRWEIMGCDAPSCSNPKVYLPKPMNHSKVVQKKLVPPIYNNISIDFGSGDQNIIFHSIPGFFEGSGSGSTTRSTGQSSGGSTGAPVPWQRWWYLAMREKMMFIFFKEKRGLLNLIGFVMIIMRYMIYSIWCGYFRLSFRLSCRISVDKG